MSVIIVNFICIVINFIKHHNVNFHSMGDMNNPTETYFLIVFTNIKYFKLIIRRLRCYISARPSLLQHLIIFQESFKQAIHISIFSLTSTPIIIIYDIKLRQDTNYSHLRFQDKCRNSRAINSLLKLMTILLAKRMKAFREFLSLQAR